MNLYKFKYSLTVNFFKLTNKMKDKILIQKITESKLKTGSKQQTNMLNLFVEFGFQVFNMKTLFYFKLRICAGMIDNLKTRNIALILTPFRSTEVFKISERFLMSI